MITNIDEWTKENLPLESFSNKPLGLSKYKKILEENCPDLLAQGSKVIIIGGTNGKGETCRRLSYLIEKSGFSYGLWTSPHLLSVKERFIYNGQMASDHELIQLTSDCKKYCEELSYYEFLFLIFCRWIQKKNFDYLILEVGLGGRLDSVNSFDGKYAGLTSIGLEHTEFLGNDELSILKEKIEISRSGSLLFSNIEQHSLKLFMDKYCHEKRVILRDITSSHGENWSYKEKNKQLAVKIFEEIQGVSLKNFDWSEYTLGVGRGEWIFQEFGSFLFIGSHNLSGIKAMLQWVEGEHFDYLLFSFSKRPHEQLIENFEYIVKEGQEIADKLSFLRFRHPKALGLELYRTILNGKYNEELFQDYDSIPKYIEYFRKLNNGKTRVLVTGSYYFISEFIKAFSCSNNSHKF